ncbi:MAG: hypothetical protein U0694_28320 [Anaerolineae bacterium]
METMNMCCLFMWFYTCDGFSDEIIAAAIGEAIAAVLEPAIAAAAISVSTVIRRGLL